MVFVESSIFTAQVEMLLDDEEYGELQLHLAEHPDAGALIQGTGGLRKIRWSVADSGKRGGVRVIYYYIAQDQRIRMLLIYRKGVQDTLTAKQKTTLRQLNERWH